MNKRETRSRVLFQRPLCFLQGFLESDALRPRDNWSRGIQIAKNAFVFGRFVPFPLRMQIHDEVTII
jgi:hypothetical protein